MKKDIRIIPEEAGTVTFNVYGASEDTGLMLLQRLYVLLLSPVSEEYRSGNEGYTLLRFLEGGNIPSDDMMNAVLAISCANAINSLDADDIANIQEFYGTCEDGIITCTLTLTDGTTLKGVLSNG